MSRLQEIIKRGLLTEKTNQLKLEQNQIAIVVDKKATKAQIKQAFEKLFEVKVESVRTMIMRGKQKRMGRYVGMQSNWKKAIVQLKEGQTVEFVEGV